MNEYERITDDPTLAQAEEEFGKLLLLWTFRLMSSQGLRL
jgi:hypothetical protein